MQNASDVVLFSQFHVGGCIAKQCRRQIKASAKDPSSLKLRRDRVYLLDCLSRRNVMKPEADDRRFDKRLPARHRRTQFAKITPQQTKKIPGIVLLSHSQIYSTIAAGALNYRVREGNVCFCSAIDTGNIISISKKTFAPYAKKIFIWCESNEDY